MSLLWLAQWLAETGGSVALHGSIYAYPVTESVHVWALALFVGMAAVLDLRLLGWANRQTPVSQLARSLLPWMFAGFVVMVVSGAMLFYAIPVRTYQSIWFRFKFALLILAGVNAWLFHATIWLTVHEWDRDPVTPKAARFAGAASLALWVSIIFAGRFIAYNWFDCDHQPQPAIVNLLSGCVPALESGKD